MNKYKKYILLFLVLLLCISIAGCGLRGFVKNVQANIENFGAVTKTGQGKR